MFGVKSEAAIRNCPWTRGSHGVIHIPPALIAELSGCVQDKDEWALVCKGRRDGLETWIESFHVPKQKRTSAHVDLDEAEWEDIVCVIHSHNSMSAFFSSEDETKLNPHFPLSIVIAQGNTVLGFKFKADGRNLLPCGSLGIISYDIVPTDPDWPWPVTPKFEQDNGLFGDCKKVKDGELVDKYWINQTSECGIEKRAAVGSVYGRTNEMMKEIEANSTKIEYFRPNMGNLPGIYQPGKPTGKMQNPYALQNALRGEIEDEDLVNNWINRANLPNWANDPRQDADWAQLEGSRLKDVSGVFVYLNKYNCPKCGSEWSDEGTAGEEDVCSVCPESQFIVVRPFSSTKIESENSELGNINIEYRCTSCTVEGTFSGIWSEFTRQKCMRCGNDTLQAVFSEQPEEHRRCLSCQDDGMYTNCSQKKEVCPTCKQKELVRVEPQNEVQLIKSKKSVLDFFKKGVRT